MTGQARPSQGGMIDIDPAAIARCLAAHRAQVHPWAEAWADATKDIDLGRGRSAERSVYRFMERHFRAAYQRSPSSLGRCNVPERDVSAAIKAVATIPTQALAGGRGVVQGNLCLLGKTVHIRKVAPTDYESCRSGDGCDRPAVRGQFGVMWCEHHGAELERVRRMFPGGTFGSGRAVKSNAA